MRYLVLIFFILSNAVFVSGQSKNVDAIDKAVSKFCKCAEKANDKVDFEKCGQIINSLSQRNFSQSDSLHLIESIKNGCDEIMRTFLESEFSKKSRKLDKTLFDENDLAPYHLKKESSRLNSVKWSALDKDQEIDNLSDLRESFSSDSLAISDLEQQKKAMLSTNYKAIAISSSEFDKIEAYSFEVFKGYHICQVYGRRGNLVCFLLISLKSDNSEIIQELVNKLSEKVKAFD